MRQVLLVCTGELGYDGLNGTSPGKLVRHMQNLSYTYAEYLICIGLGPSISSVICKNPSYSGPSYPSSPVVTWGQRVVVGYYDLRTLEAGVTRPIHALV